MISLRVAFADTDAMGIVHHSNYLRFFEVARITWLRNNGIDYKDWQKRGENLPLIESHCRYRKPSRFDDVLEIVVKPKVAGARLTLDYEIFNSETKTLIATGYTQHVCVDLNMKLKNLPDDLVNIVKNNQ
jgi:acyl-CoA thioester hydrolase